MRKINPLMFTVAVTAALLFFSGTLYAATSLTCGGKIESAGGPVADKGRWLVYSPEDSALKAEGMVGGYAPSYWAGETGAFLGSFSVGQSLTVVIEIEAGGETAFHEGYFATVTHTLANEDPALFPTVTLSAIPVPSAQNYGNIVKLAWSAPDAETVENIAGYDVYRSIDGVAFEKINTGAVRETSFEDGNPPENTAFYAVGLVFDGIPEVSGGILSANSNSVRESDNDLDGIKDIADPDDDNDRMPDVWETTHHLNPLVDDALDDPDLDDHSNYDEYFAMTDPQDDNSVPAAKGDVDGNGQIELRDALLAAQVAAGLWPTHELHREAGLNNKIDIPTAVYVLKKMASDW